MRFVLLAYKTGTLNTLYKILLSKEVNYYEGRDNHNTAGILDYVEVERLTRILGVKMLGNVLDNVGHHPRTVILRTDEEETCVELIRPLPGEGKEEDRDHHRYGKRKDDLEEGSECTGTVNIRRLLKLVGSRI